MQVSANVPYPNDEGYLMKHHQPVVMDPQEEKVQESRPKNTSISSIPPQLRRIAASDRRPREDLLAS